MSKGAYEDYCRALSVTGAAPSMRLSRWRWLPCHKRRPVSVHAPAQVAGDGRKCAEVGYDSSSVAGRIEARRSSTSMP
jgi:hypothetical protein